MDGRFVLNSHSLGFIEGFCYGGQAMKKILNGSHRVDGKSVLCTVE